MVLDGIDALAGRHRVRPELNISIRRLRERHAEHAAADRHVGVDPLCAEQPRAEQRVLRRLEKPALVPGIGGRDRHQTQGRNDQTDSNGDMKSSLRINYRTQLYDPVSRAPPRADRVKLAF
jgi:hypothetical protein